MRLSHVPSRVCSRLTAVPKRPSAFVEFAAAADPSDDEGYEALHFVVDVADLSAASLSRAVSEWTAALGREKAASLLRDPALADQDPWFGFGVRCGKKLMGEASVMQALGDEDPAPVVAFVRALIAFNEKHQEQLEGPLYTHEELETGSGAVKWLLLRDLRHLDLYIEFLVLDLDHTVAQVDTLFALAKRYTPAELAPLTRWAAEQHAQLLNDWLKDDRAWKP